MKLTHLLRRNFRFHRRGNFAVFLGVAVGTAVLTGALLVGDSLQGSLRDLTERRLGWVDQVMMPGRFFNLNLNDLVTQDHNGNSTRPVDATVIPAMARSVSKDGVSRRVSRISLWGTGDDFWRVSELNPPYRPLIEKLKDRLWPEPPSPLRPGRVRWLGGMGSSWGGFWETDAPAVVLSAALAKELAVGPGDTIRVGFRVASDVPRETLLGRRDGADSLRTIRLTVNDVLPEGSFGSNFTLAPTSAPPLNAYVPRGLLMEEFRDLRRNVLLASGEGRHLQEQLAKALTLADWGLVLHDPEERTEQLLQKLHPKKPDEQTAKLLTRSEWRGHIAKVLAQHADPKTGILSRDAILAYYRNRGYLSLESKQMLLEPAVVDAAMKTAKECGMMAAPTLVYLANRIEFVKDGPSIPYSVIAALDPNLPPPLGPFMPAGVKQLKDNEIILADWKDSPLRAKVGDSITLTYFQPEQEGREMKDLPAIFKLAGFVPLEGVADDPDLTPEFPGITDKLTLKDWNPPFPYDNNRVKKRDEDYWNDYRTTPKAYITLKKGQELWGSRFGNLTSIRLAPPAGKSLEQAAKEFTARLQANLDPKKGGFVFEDVRARGLQSSSGGTDFSELFLYFSCFLIVAALLLVGLLFRLNIDRRASEIGLLLACGYRRRAVRRLLLMEGAIVAALGGLLGCVIAVGYAWGLLELLRSWWPGTLDRSFLRLHVTGSSFLIGYFASFFVSLLTIAWAVRILGKTAPSALLAGETTAADSGKGEPMRCWGGWVALMSGLLGIGLVMVGTLVPDAEARAGTFFGGGFFLLSAGLSLVWFVMRRQDGSRVAASPRLHVATLAIRNAARHPVRSLLTAGLLASAAFLIVAVESFRRQPESNFLDKNSGSGGFTLLGESDVPIYQDLNQGPGRDELTEALERAKIPPDRLDGVTFFPFRLRSGDDASCLNLYKPGKPRLLGVPRSLVQRGGFHFADAATKEANPWELLEKPAEDGAIPVFGEANTVQWMLKSKLGGIVEVPDERGQMVKLRIAGLLQDSVFQSELLMSEANFLRLYPRQEGYSFFLIDAPPARTDEVKGLLDTALANRGFEAASTAQKLASYLAVENTYLSTFQALGGLGLMLGAFGLAVVLLRSVWERRGELALLRALGFRREVLGRLVFAENVFLLAAGLGIGTAAAVLSVLPHVLGGGGEVPWLRLAGLLVLVVLIGLGSGTWAMRATLRAPLLPALRRE